MDANGKDYVYDVDMYNQVSKKKEVAFPSAIQDDIKLPLTDKIPQTNKQSNNKPVKSTKMDSNGRTLTPGQQNYFKDSKVRDDQGRILVVYHGTPQGGFTVFRTGLTYFTANKNYANRYTRINGKTQSGDNPEVYEGYLNITKPFDLTDKNIRKIYIDEYIKGGYAQGINPLASEKEIQNYVSNGIDWTEADNLKDFIDENEYDFDGIILNEGGDITEFGTIMRGDSYVAFDSNQFKNIDNLNPTQNPDIRYSNKIKFEMKGWFENTKPEERKKAPGFFNLGRTSNPLSQIGLADKKIIIGKSKIQTILDMHEEMTEDDIIGVVDLINEPMVVMSSATDKKHSLVLFGERIVKGMPVMASLRVSADSGEIEDYVVTSTYGRPKEQLQNFLNHEIIYWINPQKEKTNAWLSVLRVQFPSPTIKYGLVRKVPQSMRTSSDTNVPQENKQSNNKSVKSTKLPPEAQRLIDELTLENKRLTEENTALKVEKGIEKAKAEKKAIIDKITEQSQVLSRWLLTNDKNNPVPQSIKEPLGKLLTSIKLTKDDYEWRKSKGQLTKAEESLGQRMAKISQLLLEIDQDKVVDKEAYDLSQLDWLPTFSKEFVQIKDAVAAAEARAGETFTLSKMSTEDLQNLSNMITALKTAITNINKCLSAHSKMSVSGIGRAIVN